MPTVKHNISGHGWKKVADASADFLLEVGRNAPPVRVTYQASQPSGNEVPYHFLFDREGMVRTASGHVYARSHDGRETVVVVST